MQILGAILFKMILSFRNNKKNKLFQLNATSQLSQKLMPSKKNQ